MTRKYIAYGISIALASIISLGAHAQAPSDAYRNTQKELSGTARAQALGGAIGAVGADASAVSTNPAGIGLYTSSALSLSFEAGKGKASTLWQKDANSFGMSDKWAIGTVNNFSISTPLIRRSTSRLWHINWGFACDREYDYRRNYNLISSAPKFGLTDYIAFEASRKELPLKTKFISPIIDIARDARWIEGFSNVKNLPEDDFVRYRTLFSAMEKGFGPKDGRYILFTPAASKLNVQESGSRNVYDMNIGIGYSDQYYFGATLKVGSQASNRVAQYIEDFRDDYNGHVYESNLTYETGLSTSGTTLGLNLGALVALGDYGRIGISYLLPQLGYYTEVYWAKASGKNDAYVGSEFKSASTGNLESSYRALIPGRLSLSALAFLGRYGFITYDYQLRSLGGAKIYEPNGSKEISESAYIKEDFGVEHSHHVGIEVRPLSMLSLRAGYSFTGNPMKAEQLKSEPQDGLSYNYVPSGYITDFVLPRSYQTITAGAGINITRHSTLDIAYVYGKRTEKVYPFSGSSATGMIIDDTKPELVRGNVHMNVKGGDLTTDKHKFVATLTFRY